MELVKNIFFNTDKLIENSKIKISYTGKLFRDNSQDVYIHYGYNSNWENSNDLQMVKTELGYQIEFTLSQSGTLNFCFRNEYNLWDNNNNQNYIFNIEKAPMSLQVSNSKKSISKSNRLRRCYLWSKKIKLAIYKIITYLPRLISGNYKRRLSHD